VALMTGEQYNRRIAQIERYCNNTAFLCEPECNKDFYYHAEALMVYLTTIVEAEFYGVPDPELYFPSCPCKLASRFLTEEAKFRQKWREEDAQSSSG
jgi:hypothetical protein